MPPTTKCGHESTERGVVYVVDDDELVRRAISNLLRSVGLHVVTFAASGEFIDAPKHDAPSCLILDVRLRGENGLALQDKFARSDVQMPILFLTGHGDIGMSVKAMKAGAFDFLTKPFRDQEMLDAVAAALLRDHERLARERSLASLRAAYNSLTAREREVMAFVVSGLLNKQIASEMNVKEITVKVHRGQAMKKMGARSVPDLVRKAEALGVQPLSPKS
ncbi:LuxR family transcriptional regulator [Burkholderia ubonensis]|uniref:LuxR family transcriptional regulator n=1 Tax=Burkholderia ubonensis TaxID=101571 RepID=A0ABD4E426_9BURK|nr:response regulator [Burkholderia ubonensis]KVH67200.1 LuxR family transcriptional regulator [Burkholderia ubonensis]KVM05717.1 LuxR family transcriptional regulator [Burkholderia ubonensis]KVM09861.1 LuxR family transcriptional regulator [Burkholderia ubonensis]KVM52955.1 LuxR family transcriptional regulator [Burkholderia ubonensis]KVM61916.1 LuxR family transcriptional regulator [Burkholderia ubonensis]